MKTIIHVISSTELFGPQKTVLHECVALNRLGWRAEVVNLCARPDAPVAADYRNAGVQYSEIVCRAHRTLADAASLRDRIRESRSTVLHAHGYKPDIYSLLAARGSAAATVTTIHGWTADSPKVRFYEWLAARSWRYYDAVISVSENYRNIALRFGVPPSRCTVMHNAILPSYASDHAGTGDRAAARAELRVKDDELAIAMVGRLSPEKRHHLGIEVLRAIAGQQPNARLCIIGDGPERKAIEALVLSTGLASKVRMLGHRADVARLYSGIDALLITSEREGVPNVMLEAMLWGKPVIATAVGGIPEVIADPSQGLLAERDDHATLIAQVLRVTKDPALGARIGAAARARILESFDFQRRVARSVELYDAVLANR